MAEQISAGVGHPVTYVDAPPATWRLGLLAAAVPAPGLGQVVQREAQKRRFTLE